MLGTIVKVNGNDLSILEYQDTWSIPEGQVAQAYNLTQSALKKQRSRNVQTYVEGTHYYYKDVYNDGRGNLTEMLPTNGRWAKTQKMLFWTKKGILLLGFRLKETPQVITFRDWASDFVICHPTHNALETYKALSAVLYLAMGQAGLVRNLLNNTSQKEKTNE